MSLCSQLLIDSLFSDPTQMAAKLDQMIHTLNSLPRPACTTPLFQLMNQLSSVFSLQKICFNTWRLEQPATAESTQTGTLMNVVVEYQAKLFLTSQGMWSSTTDRETKVETVMRQLSVYQQYNAWVKILFDPFKFSTPYQHGGDDVTSIGQYARAGFTLLHPDKNRKMRGMSVVWDRLSEIGFKIMSQEGLKVSMHAS